MTLRAALAVATCLFVAGRPAMAQEKSLTVCMQTNDPPLSVRAGDRPGGFVLALSRAVARRLGRDVRVQWFVSRDDPDANLAKEANALLSDGRCDLVAEYALSTGTLARPLATTAKLPPFDGATADDRRRWVTLGVLAATQPYRYDALTVVLPDRDAARHIGTLADLDGLRVGVELATLADAIAMAYGDGRLIEHVVHVHDARTLFERLQRGELDAALVGLHEFDAWRLRDGAGGLVAADYRHSIGFNIGFVGLDSNVALIGEVNEAIGELQARDQIAPLAREARLSYMAPRIPAVSPDVRPAALTGD